MKFLARLSCVGMIVEVADKAADVAAKASKRPKYWVNCGPQDFRSAMR